MKVNQCDCSISRSKYERYIIAVMPVVIAIEIILNKIKSLMIQITLLNIRYHVHYVDYSV